MHRSQQQLLPPRPPMDDDHLQPRHRRRPPWLPTLVAQAALCLVLFAALNLAGSGGGGRSRTHAGSGGLYFLSVRGGSRPAGEQTQLLKQMGSVAAALEAQFVVDISEHGENDPLLMNATLHFPSLKMPWYATSVSGGSGASCFHGNFPVHQGQSLDVLGVDTGLFKDFSEVEHVNGSSSELYNWLASTLAVATGSWRIVAGFHPLIECEEGTTIRKVKTYQHLHHIFLKHSVDVYLSKGGCSRQHYTEYEGISYMENPSQADEEVKDSMVDDTPNINREMHNGFHLLRIGPFEIESYYINSSGDVVSQQIVHQREKQSM